MYDFQQIYNVSHYDIRGSVFFSIYGQSISYKITYVTLELVLIPLQETPKHVFSSSTYFYTVELFFNLLN
jgi:hypothetical protein